MWHILRFFPMKINKLYFSKKQLIQFKKLFPQLKENCLIFPVIAWHQYIYIITLEIYVCWFLVYIHHWKRTKKENGEARNSNGIFVCVWMIASSSICSLLSCTTFVNYEMSIANDKRFINVIVLKLLYTNTDNVIISRG